MEELIVFNLGIHVYMFIFYLDNLKIIEIYKKNMIINMLYNCTTSRGRHVMSYFA